MTRNNFLKAIIFVSLAAVIVLPTYIITVLEPAFTDFTTKTIESEAVRVGTHMAETFFKNTNRISKSDLPENMRADIPLLQQDFHIIKVKVFAPDGEIVFSTSPEDIGTVNTNDYFHGDVASGRAYTKVVKKDQKTLEGQALSVDVVETYVPIMKNGSFAGAFEIYYNITESKKQLSKLLLQSKQTSIGISLCLLLAVMVSSFLAFKSLRTQKHAEDALKQAYDDLETRVQERTAELNEANRQLHQVIIVRKAAEAEKEELIKELQTAIEQVKTLRGLLPICSSCQQIRDKNGNWNRIDEYLQEHTEAELTHGICPKCARTLYPELYSSNTEETC